VEQGGKPQCFPALWPNLRSPFAVSALYYRPHTSKYVMSPTAKTVSELAAHVGGHAFGDGNAIIHRVARLETADGGEIAYVEDEKFFAAASASKASCSNCRHGSSASWGTRPA